MLSAQCNYNFTKDVAGAGAIRCFLQGWGGFEVTPLDSRIQVQLEGDEGGDSRAGNYLHPPPIGVVHPLLTLAHAPNCAPPLGCAYCSSGVFVHSVGF